VKYKLNVKTDVDQCEDGYMVFLPYGFRWNDDIVHVRGFDTMSELRAAAKTDVVTCDCAECIKHLVPAAGALSAAN
jgi:hypothetical protein